MSSFHDFELTGIDGDDMPLSSFTGKTVLVVNVASECGLTPQYTALEKIYREHKDAGLVVLGVPCNQFDAQEPGTEAEIKAFCETNYQVTFPLSSKIDVNGENRHPLYQWLAGDGAKFPGDIDWNFGKFLIDRDGQVLQRFEPDVEPDSAPVTEALAQALK